MGFVRIAPSGSNWPKPCAAGVSGWSPERQSKVPCSSSIGAAAIDVAMLEARADISSVYFSIGTALTTPGTMA